MVFDAVTSSSSRGWSGAGESMSGSGLYRRVGACRSHLHLKGSKSRYAIVALSHVMSDTLPQELRMKFIIIYSLHFTLFSFTSPVWPSPKSILPYSIIGPVSFPVNPLFQWPCPKSSIFIYLCHFTPIVA